MPTNVTVVLKDEPGQLAKLGAATGEAGVNINGMCAFTGEGRGIVNILVDDADAARQALDAAGMGVADTRDALVVDVANRAGSLGEMARELAEASVNIELIYTTFGNTRIVIVTDDMASAREALA